MRKDRTATRKPDRGDKRWARCRTLAACLLALVFCATEGWATDLGPASQPTASSDPHNKWQIDFTPYGWFTNLDGKVQFGGIEHGISYNIFEILFDTDDPFEVDGAFEARKGPFSFFARLDYFNLELDDVETRDFRPIRSLTIDVDANARVKTDTLIIEAGGGLEVWKLPMNGAASYPHGSFSEPAFVALDVIGGARYNWLESTADVEVDITEIFTPGFLPVRLSASQRFVVRITTDEKWVDPFVGGVLRVQTPSGLGFFARGDVGGFHVGSDFVWQVYSGFTGTSWFCEKLSWLLAYRALDTDYETGSGLNRFGYDMLIHGPIAGMTYRF